MAIRGKEYGDIYVRRKKTKPGQPGWWDEKKRMQAVTTYIATGNVSLTAKTINVPVDTVRIWKTKDWWKEMMNELQSGSDLKLSKSLEKVVEKSLSAVEEILTNGDYHYDAKAGMVVRVPAKLRDLNKISVDFIDRQTMLQDRQKPVQQDAETTEGRLLKLAEQFAKFVQGKQIEEKVVNEVIEGQFQELPQEYQHAVHDQREERLQEGAPMGAFPETQQGEGQSCEKQS